MSWGSQPEGRALWGAGGLGRGVKHPSHIGDVGRRYRLCRKVRDQAKPRPIAEPPLDDNAPGAKRSITIGKFPAPALAHRVSKPWLKIAEEQEGLPAARLLAHEQ